MSAVDKTLRELVGRYPGIALNVHGNEASLRSAAGATLKISRANKLDRPTLSRIQKWLDGHSQMAQAASRARKHYRDDGEKANNSGPGMATSARRTSLKRLETLRREWPKMLTEEQIVFVSEAVVALAEQDPRFHRAREVFGV